MSDLFLFLAKANQGDLDYVDRMSEDEVKAISPFVLMGWALGAEENNVHHTVMTDSLVNDKVFSLSRHPRLLLKLFVVANNGIDNTRYRFVRPAPSKGTKEVKAIADYYGCSIREAEDYAPILDKEDRKTILALAESRA